MVALPQVHDLISKALQETFTGKLNFKHMLGVAFSIKRFSSTFCHG